MLSLPHLIVLFVIALVIFGPQKLPELARMLGKATAEFRKMTNDFRYTLESEVRDLERQSRIHQEEIAAAARAVQPSPAPPEGAMPRELPTNAPVDSDLPVPTNAPVQAAPEEPSEAAPEPFKPETVTAPHEKPN